MKKLLWLAAITMLLNSCKVFFPDRLFKIETDKLAMSDTLRTPKEYVIRPGDLLAMGVFSNNGYQLVDVLTQENSSFSAMKYLVRSNGFAILPMLDSVSVAGMSIAQAEQMLAQKYSYYFVNPFIRIDVTNRNVYVFRGRTGAQVVTLDHDNTNLIEVIAKAGGVPIGGKAYRVRILRGDLNNPTVFDIDLSTVEGMQKANLTMVANDVVYIESRLTSSDVLSQYLPVLTFVSTTLALVLTIQAVFK